MNFNLKTEVNINDDMERCDEFDTVRNRANEIACDMQEFQCPGIHPHGLISTQVKAALWVALEMNRLLRHEIQNLRKEIDELKKAVGK